MEEGGAERVEVAHRGGLAKQLFGGHVARGAGHREAVGGRCAATGDAKVDEDRGAVRADDDVAGLDVPMDDGWGALV